MKLKPPPVRPLMSRAVSVFTMKCVTELSCSIEGGPKNENQMRVLLEGKLPPYMRPGECIRVKRMPENANGKIDRKYLKSYYTDLMDGQAIG